MAKFGIELDAIDIEATDKSFSGGGVLPHMHALIWAEAIEIRKTKDDKGYEANITFEVQEPVAFKGRKFWGNWTILHPEGFSLGAYKYGKPQFDKFARAVGVNVTPDTDTDELIFKSFVIETGLNVGGPNPNKPGENYKDQNQIANFFFDDARSREMGKTVPELGLIGDGEFEKRAPKAANSNVAARPSANSNASASGEKKRNPWDKAA